jgi:hypothetical protein
MTRDHTVEECQRFAAECLDTLKVTLDPTRRAELLETAKEWLRMAETSEKHR